MGGLCHGIRDEGDGGGQSATDAQSANVFQSGVHIEPLRKD